MVSIIFLVHVHLTSISILLSANVFKIAKEINIYDIYTYIIYIIKYNIYICNSTILHKMKKARKTRLYWNYRLCDGKVYELIIK